MRARVVTALLVVGGSIAAVSWAYATRDLRRLEALRRQVETDAALERARVSRRREALRGSAGPRVDASVLEGCFHAIPNDTDVATIRSALASDRAPVIDAVRRAGPSAVAAAFKLEGFGRVDGLEASRIALDLWRLFHDAAREGTVEDAVALFGQDDALWLLDTAVDDLDADGCRAVLRELDVLLASRPSFAPIVERSRIEADRRALELPGEQPSPAAVHAALASYAAIDAELSAMAIESGDVARRLAASRVSLGHPPIPGELDFETLDRLETPPRPRPDDPAREPTAGARFRVAVVFGARAWLRDLAALRVARIGVALRLFYLTHGGWPSTGAGSALEARGAEPPLTPGADGTIDPATGAPLAVERLKSGDAVLISASAGPQLLLRPKPAATPGRERR